MGEISQGTGPRNDPDAPDPNAARAPLGDARSEVGRGGRGQPPPLPDRS